MEAQRSIVNGLFNSTIGKKALMAISGGLIVIWLLLHMAGNAQIFIGAEAVNKYAAMLKSVPELLWTMRIGLLALIAVHLWAAISLSTLNKTARPMAYRKGQAVGASLASRTMLVSGLIVLGFVIYHLLHFTIGITHPDLFGLHDAEGRHDVAAMVIGSFQNPLLVVGYVVSVGLVCLHLSHGVASVFRSLGLTSPGYRPNQEKLSLGLAVVLFIGFCAVPTAILLGLVK